MGKVGRNEQCPCGSGRKFKHCCLVKQQAGMQQQQPQSPGEAMRVSLMKEIEAAQELAVARKLKIRELGVFILLSTEEGDGWLLEITDSDCVRFAEGGELLEVPIDENPETIEINWSHTYDFKDKCFTTTSYADKAATPYPSYPAQEITAAIRRMIKKFPKEMLNKVHIDPEKQEADS